jgi:hypothetical protein
MAGQPADAGRLTPKPMPTPDEPGLRHYERKPTRVRAGSGGRWLLIWCALAVAVASVGIAGTLATPRDDGPDAIGAPVAEAAATGVVAEAAPAAQEAKLAPPRTARALPPIDITSGASGYAAAFDARRRQSTPLIVESTDFHANAGAAYYGIGGRLIRALGPRPTRTPNPGDAP